MINELWIDSKNPFITSFQALQNFKENFQINFGFAHLKGLGILAPKQFRYIVVAS